MAMPPETYRVLLLGGPFDRETRIVSATHNGNLPDVLVILDPIQTFEDITEAMEMSGRWENWAYYTRDLQETKARGVWRYHFKPRSAG